MYDDNYEQNYDNYDMLPFVDIYAKYKIKSKKEDVDKYYKAINIVDSEYDDLGE